MIIITSRIEGFRRAGVAHSTTPTPYAADRFTQEQLAQLHADPNLVVQLLHKSEAETVPGSMVDSNAAPATAPNESATTALTTSEGAGAPTAPETGADSTTTVTVEPAPVTVDPNAAPATAFTEPATTAPNTSEQAQAPVAPETGADSTTTVPVHPALVAEPTRDARAAPKARGR